MDLIYRDEVLEAIDGMFSKSLAKTRAQDAVRSVPAAWNMTEDTIPLKTGPYLSYMKNGNIKVGHFTTYNNTWTDGTPVAWMPLPDPPEVRK